VVIVGIPNADITDIKIELKKRHCERTNYPWWDYYNYLTQMCVNQAIGRVIRDKNDYGAIILIDERYRSDWHRNECSKTVSPWMLMLQERPEECETVNRLC